MTDFGFFDLFVQLLVQQKFFYFHHSFTRSDYLYFCIKLSSNSLSVFPRINSTENTMADVDSYSHSKLRSHSLSSLPSS